MKFCLTQQQCAMRRLVVFLVVAITHSGKSVASFDHLNSGEAKIVNGNTSIPHKYPSVLALRYLSLTVCGATILDKHWALTAAHCLRRYPGFPNITEPVGINLYAGVHDMRLTESHIQNVTVTQVIPHELYQTEDGNKAFHDVALLRVDPPFLFTSKVAPVNLPDCNFRVDEDWKVTAYAVGWGAQAPPATPTRPPYVPFLQEVDVPLVTIERCQDVFGWNEEQQKNKSTVIDEDGSICAGYKEGGKDACGGDSGGPLFVYNEGDGTHTQVGITSWGFSCALPNYYGVYAMVSKYLHWINWHVKNCTAGAGRRGSPPRQFE